MINFARVITKTTRRLHCDKYVTVHSARHQKITIIFHYGTGSFAPVLNELSLHLGFKSIEEFFIFSSTNLVGFGKLLFCQQIFIVSRVGSKFRNKFLGICWDGIHFVTASLHRRQNPTDTFDSIQANGTTNIGISRRIVMEDNSNFFVSICFTAQACPFSGLAYHSLHTFGNWQVTYITISQNFFISNRHTVNSAIKFR